MALLPPVFTKGGMQITSLQKSAYIFASCIAAYLVFITVLVVTQPDSVLHELFSETGFFETASIYLWGLAAVAVPICLRPVGLRESAITLFFVLCALREADWHKKFTVTGISKMNYYTKTDAPLVEKFLAAMVVGLFILLVAYLIVSFFKQFRRRESLDVRATFIACAGLFVLFLTKALDRSLSMIKRRVGIQFSDQFKHYVGAYEEGLEMVAPLLFLVALLVHRFVTAKRREISHP